MDSIKDAVGLGDNGPKTRTSYFPSHYLSVPPIRTSEDEKDFEAGLPPALWEVQPCLGTKSQEGGKSNTQREA